MDATPTPPTTTAAVRCVFACASCVATSGAAAATAAPMSANTTWTSCDFSPSLTSAWTSVVCPSAVVKTKLRPPGSISIACPSRRGAITLPSSATLTSVRSLPCRSFASKTTVGMRASRSVTIVEHSLIIHALQLELAQARAFSRASRSLSPGECARRSACS